MTKMYLAGASKEPERVKKAMAAVRALGIEITCDWLAAIEAEGAANEGPDDVKRRKYALADFDGIDRADIVWVLAPDAYSTGAWAELGYAIAAKHSLDRHRRPLQVIVSGPARERCVFAVLALEFDTDEEALAWLSTQVSAG